MTTCKRGLIIKSCYENRHLDGEIVYELRDLGGLGAEIHHLQGERTRQGL